MRHDRDVSDLIAQAIRRLSMSGVRLDRGLSDEEISQIEDTFRFAFGPEHRAFLLAAVPVGQSWPDWRNDRQDDLRGRLDWPVDGVIFDVHNNDFWPASWGDRPDAKDERERAARAHLARPETHPGLLASVSNVRPRVRPEPGLLGPPDRHHLLRRQPPRLRRSRVPRSTPASVGPDTCAVLVGGCRRC